MASIKTRYRNFIAANERIALTRWSPAIVRTTKFKKNKTLARTKKLFFENLPSSDSYYCGNLYLYKAPMDPMSTLYSAIASIDD